MMFFRKKRSYHLPLGILIGTAVGFAGAAAIATANKEMRKTMSKELKKCYHARSSAMNGNIFALK